MLMIQLLLYLRTHVNAEDELAYVCQWSDLKKLTVNFNKTKELVFHRPGLRGFREPSPFDKIEHLSEFKLLGVHLSTTLSMELHMNYIISVVNQRFFLLSSLKKEGLPLATFQIIFQALIVSHVTYALPAFSGFLSAGDIARMNVVFRKAMHWGLIDSVFFVEDVIREVQDRVFKQIASICNHSLHSLLPAEIETGYNLRKHGHKYQLPSVTTALFRKAL